MPKMLSRVCLSFSLMLSFFSPCLFAVSSSPTPNAQSDIPLADYYREIGIPALTHPWTPNDYLQVAAVLGRVAQQDPKRLFNYADSSSAPYMQHMADGNNLYQILRFANSHEQRLELITLYLDGIQRLFILYQNMLAQSYALQTEWVDIVGLSSYLAALSAPEWKMYLVAAAQNGSAPEELDSQYENKLAAINVLQTALVNPVIVAVKAIPKLSPVATVRLLTELKRTLPSYANSLPVAAQQTLYEAIVHSFQQTQDQQIRDDLRELAGLIGR